MLHGPSIVSLADLVARVEAVLSSEAALALGLQLASGINYPGDAVTGLLHRGVSVNVPAQTQNTGLYRDATMCRVEDRISITLTYVVRPDEQRACRAEALVLEEQVRCLLTGTPLLPYRLRYLGASNRRTVGGAEWIVITQDFAAQRDAALGG